MGFVNVQCMARAFSEVNKTKSILSYMEKCVLTSASHFFILYLNGKVGEILINRILSFLWFREFPAGKRIHRGFEENIYIGT